MKARAQPITMLTAYDYPFARIFDEAGIDVLLVGDSLGMVVQGATAPCRSPSRRCSTTPAHGRARPPRALVVADMPFLSYQVSAEDALRNAGRLIKEGGAEAVKLEGGVAVAETVRAPRRRRHPGDGPHRADAAVDPSDGRASRAGPQIAGRAAGCRERLLEDAARTRGRRRVRDRARGNAGGAGARDHRERRGPDHRHRRRARLRRPGAGDARHARPDESFEPRFAKPFAHLWKDVVGGRRRLRARSEGARFSGSGTLLRDQGGTS